MSSIQDQTFLTWALDCADASTTTYDTIGTLTYTVNGVFCSAAAVTNGVTPVVDGNTGLAFVALDADETCWFVWGINAAGTVKLVQGNITAGDPDTDQPKVYPTLPSSLPFGYIPFAIQRCATSGAASAWTIGTSNWDATGATNEVYNVSTMPVRAPTDTTL